MCKSVHKLESKWKIWPEGQPGKVWCWWVGLIPDQHSNEGGYSYHLQNKSTIKSSPYFLRAIKQSPRNKKIEDGVWDNDWSEILGVQMKQENS